MADSLTLERLRVIAQETLPKGCVAWLYGSRARGDERPDSDWDVLILLDKQSVQDEDFEVYGYPMIEKGWHYGADINPQIYTHKEWEQMSMIPYCKNVEHDKKIIYES